MNINENHQFPEDEKLSKLIIEEHAIHKVNQIAPNNIDEPMDVDDYLDNTIKIGEGLDHNFSRTNNVASMRHSAD